MVAHVYMLRCADGSYYVGSTRKPLDERIREHLSGAVDGYTARRLPVILVWANSFERHTDAFEVEKQIKGWSRRKKEALICGDWDAIQAFSRSYQHHGRAG